MSRRGRIVVLVTSAVVLIAAVWVVVVLIRNALTPAPGAGPECLVQPADGAATATLALADSPQLPGTAGTAAALSLTAVQLQHASTINAVGLQRGVPDRGRLIALATALQESSLRNLPNGDLDSVGLFQQRPSQGWGTAAQVADPIYASNAFYDALLEVQDWQSLPLTEAAQAVQYSAFPDAYAKWEPSAERLVQALSADSPGAVSCRSGATAPTADNPVRPPLDGTTGAAATLSTMLAEAQAELAGLTMVDLAADGRTATVSVVIADLPAGHSAAALSAWAVAHATGDAATNVTLTDRLWTPGGWGPLGQSALPDGQVRITVAG